MRYNRNGKSLYSTEDTAVKASRENGNMSAVRKSFGCLVFLLVILVPFLVAAPAGAATALDSPAAVHLQHGGGAVAATTDSADPTSSIALPYSMTIQGQWGQTQTIVNIPKGSRPTAVTGVLSNSYTREGTIIVTLDGQQIGQFSTLTTRTPQPVSVAVPETLIMNGKAELGLSVAFPNNDTCDLGETGTAELKNTTLVFTYPAALAPTTIDQFLGPETQTFTVVIPTDAEPAAVTAALNTVSALNNTFAAPTTTVIRPADDAPPADALHRNIIIGNPTASAATSDVATLSLTSPYILSVSGTSTSLGAAPLALALTDQKLFTSKEYTVVSPPVPGETNVAGTQELSALVTASSLSLQGYGVAETTIAVNQPFFGHPIDEVTFNVKGVAAPIAPGGSGRIDYLWNNELVASTSLGVEAILTRDIKIAAPQVGQRNSFTVRMTYYPPAGNCSAKALPARADINTTASTFSSSPGQSLRAGFERFPQTLTSTLPVWFIGGETTSAVIQAGNLIGALAQQTPQLYAITPETESNFLVQRKATGIVVGASPEFLKKVKAPLTRLDDVSTQPYAYIQALEYDGGNLIVSGVNGDDKVLSTGNMTRLTEEIYAKAGGWANLEGQVVVLDDGDGAYTLLNYYQPVTDKNKTKWIATGAGFAIVAGVILAWLWRRPKGKDKLPPVVPESEAS